MYPYVRIRCHKDLQTCYGYYGDNFPIPDSRVCAHAHAHAREARRWAQKVPVGTRSTREWKNRTMNSDNRRQPTPADLETNNDG